MSREILEHILDDTEEHIDYLETQIGLVAQVGEQNWLQSQMGEAKEGRGGDRSANASEPPTARCNATTGGAEVLAIIVTATVI